jgi:deazaflavin-dependent oxidoreductase (nitroreductase family)
MGSFALLTVRGRKSGKPIETPLAIFVHEGKSYLIASYGIVNWVRNLRAAGGEATITRSRHTEKIHVSMLSVTVEETNLVSHSSRFFNRSWLDHLSFRTVRSSSRRLSGSESISIAMIFRPVIVKSKTTRGCPPEDHTSPMAPFTSAG